MQHLRFFNQKFEAEEGWKLEKKGPFGLHDRFDYWKTKMEIKEDGVTVRPDDAHITDLGKTCKTWATRQKDTMRWKFQSTFKGG